MGWGLPASGGSEEIFSVESSRWLPLSWELVGPLPLPVGPWSWLSSGWLSLPDFPPPAAVGQERQAGVRQLGSGLGQPPASACPLSLWFPFCLHLTLGCDGTTSVKDLAVRGQTRVRH